MEKIELVKFLKEEHERIEEVLYSLGVLKGARGRSENYHITDRFRDALMLLKSERYDDLKGLLERASKEQWL